jgi:UDP-N-acetylglucosamine 2-epimerase (non-hydrolysing)/GDP/UDP-N,N'-diacetylbacillosamine 2-epimerase (hydrolysing)
MGENPENVFCLGAPGLENIYRLDLLSKADLCQKLLIPEDKKIGIVTYHPVTLQDNTAGYDISQVLKALKDFDDIYWVFTYPNADTGGRAITREIDRFILENPQTGRIFSSLGQLRYLSLMKHAVLMVGNSSSGIIEAPSFRLPVVNIGDRQKGRIKGGNIVDVDVCRAEDISKAILLATSQTFIDSVKDMQSPYGTGNTSEGIVNKLKEIVLTGRSTQKVFYTSG